MDAPLVILQCVAGNAPVTFTSFQEILIAHMTVFQYLWWAVWLATAAYVAFRALRYET